MSKILPVILHQDIMVPTERRIKELAEEEEVKVNVDTCTITEKLLGILTTNNRLKAGWHRRELLINPRLDESNKSTIQLKK